MDAEKVLNLLKTLINIYLFVSPFVILYLYNKSNAYKVKVTKSALEHALKEYFGISSVDDLDDYKSLVNAYGSVHGYEDARMKDFDIMREYLINLETVVSSIQFNVKSLKDYIKSDNNIEELKKTSYDFLDSMSKELSVYKEHLHNYIESEREAHASAHSCEDIIERRELDE